MKTITSSGQKIPALLTIAIEMAGYPCYTPKGVWGNAHAHAFKLAFLLLFLFGFNSAKCQHAITEAQYHDNIVTTIIKEYQYPATISYVETTGKHYFAYADATMNIINCEIEPYIFVRDFAILDRTVYFCGVDKSTGSNGIWGWFYIPDLMAGNLAYETYSHFVCGNHFVDSLHSIVAYNENNGLHVVTVGTAIDGTMKPSGCAIEVKPSQSAPNTWDYTIGVAPQSLQDKINQVCLTDNYLITSGPSYATGVEGYRRHWKNNIFDAAGPQDTLWIFAYPNFTSHLRNTHDYAITHMYGDVVASAFQTRQFGTLPLGVLVFAHDMATLTNGVVSTIFSCQQTLPTNSSLSVAGLEYDRINNNLVLLTNGSLSATNGSFIAEIPTTAGSAPPFTLYTVNGIKLTSLDMYNNLHSLVCQGYSMQSSNFCKCFTKPHFVASTCVPSFLSPSFSEVYLTKMDPAPFKLCANLFVCTQRFQVSIELIPIITNCLNIRSTR